MWKFEEVEIDWLLSERLLDVIVVLLLDPAVFGISWHAVGKRRWLKRAECRHRTISASWNIIDEDLALCLDVDLIW